MNAALILQLLIEAVNAATQYAEVLRKAQAENRDVTDAELDAARKVVADARQAAIDALGT